MDIVLEKTVIGGRYKILSSLGGGGFGRTYVAEDLQLPEYPRCVVKQLKPQAKDAPTLETARRLFDTEAKVLHRLGCYPQIPRLLAHFEEQEDFFLVQELIEGTSLDREIKPGRRWGEQYAIALLEDILPTLAFVHQQNVIHRDLKPANIIRRARDGKLVLIDFGAVKQVSSSGGSQTLTVAIGTRGYMPNEQIAGTPRPNSDIYALGAIAIQALTGIEPSRLRQHPQTCEMEWREEEIDVSEGLAAILNKMVCFYFKNRYQSAEEVLADLAKLRNSEPIQSQIGGSEPTRTEPLRNQPGTGSPRGRLPQKLLYVLLPGAIAAVAAGVVFWPRSDDLTAARNALREQNFPEAIAASERALQKQPDNPQAWKIRGDVLLSSERYLQAIASYQKATQLDPKNSQFLSSQGEALLELQRYDEALAAFEAAIALDGSDIPALNGQGLALMGLQRYEAALDAFDLARKKQPNDPKAWENRGLALASLGRSNEARKAFEEAIASYDDRINANPKDVQSRLDRGQILNKLQRLDEALTAFEEAIAVSGNFFPAWRAKANTLQNLGRSSDAIDAYKKALEIKPDSHVTLRERGRLFAQQGEWQKAIQDYDKAISLAPGFAPALSDRGFALLQLQRPQDALDAFGKALAIDKNNSQAWAGKGSAFADIKRSGEALAALDAATQIAPDDPDIWLKRGAALEKLQRPEEALEAYEKALELSPNFAPAAEALEQLQQQIRK